MSVAKDTRNLIGNGLRFCEKKKEKEKKASSQERTKGEERGDKDRKLTSAM